MPGTLILPGSAAKRLSPTRALCLLPTTAPWLRPSRSPWPSPRPPPQGGSLAVAAFGRAISVAAVASGAARPCGPRFRSSAPPAPTSRPGGQRAGANSRAGALTAGRCCPPCTVVHRARGRGQHGQLVAALLAARAHLAGIVLQPPAPPSPSGGCGPAGLRCALGAPKAPQTA